jgi:hypothetical protein
MACGGNAMMSIRRSEMALASVCDSSLDNNNHLSGRTRRLHTFNALIGALNAISSEDFIGQWYGADKLVPTGQCHLLASVRVSNSACNEWGDNALLICNSLCIIQT